MTVAPKINQVIRASVSPVPSAASTSLWVAPFAMKPKSRPPVNAAMYPLPCKLCATEKQAMASATTVTCFHISVTQPVPAPFQQPCANGGKAQANNETDPEFLNYQFQGKHRAATLGAAAKR